MDVTDNCWLGVVPFLTGYIHVAVKDILFNIYTSKCLKNDYIIIFIDLCAYIILNVSYRFQI